MKIKELKALTKGLQIHCQFDDYETVDTDEGLIIKFPILGSDPGEHFKMLDIHQKDGINIINLDWAREQIIKDAPDMRKCFLPVWRLINDAQ